MEVNGSENAGAMEVKTVALPPSSPNQLLYDSFAELVTGFAQQIFQKSEGNPVLDKLRKEKEMTEHVNGLLKTMLQKEIEKQEKKLAKCHDQAKQVDLVIRSLKRQLADIVNNEVPQ